MIANGSNFTIDAGDSPYFFNTKAKSMKIDVDANTNLETILGLLNSKLLEFIYKGISPPKRGGYRAYTTDFLSQLRVPEIESHELETHVESMLTASRERKRLNLSLLDYLGLYEDGPTISDVGFNQPPENAANSILQQTTEQKPNLRVGEATVLRESPNTVEIRLTTRYKPDDETAH